MTKKQQIPTKQAPRDAQTYLKQLEELLKRNTGTGTFIGQDTSSNIPMYLPGRVANPTGLSETPSTMTYGNGMTQPTPLERPEPEVYEDPVEEQQAGASEFLDYFDEVYSQVNPQTPGTVIGSPGQMATGVEQLADGGVLFSDGIIYYSDGTFRSGVGDLNAQPIASHLSGGIEYSDGSIRLSYEQMGLPQMSTPGGLGGLIQGIFGQDRDITQEYGAYNPSLEPGSGYNFGTDIRTRDLTGSQRAYKLPVGAEVVEVFYDDGTRWGDRSGHQGYGNSVLLRLSTGEMLRFSHMGQMADLQVGMRIQPGQVFGTPGQTGNTAGEHLDLEYYNTQGQLSNPSQFSGFLNPTTLVQGKLFSSPDDPQPVTQQLPVQQQSIQQPGQQTPTPMTDAVTSVVQAPGKVLGAVNEAVQPMSPVRQGLSDDVATFGEKHNIPEMYASEVVSGQITPRLAISKNIEEKKPTGDKFDLGGSELARGDVQGAGAIFSNTLNRVANRVGRLPKQVKDQIIPQAYAEEGSQKNIVETLGDNVKYIKDAVGEYGQKQVNRVGSALDQAGEGVKALGQSGIDKLEGVFTPKQEESKRVVGDVKGTAEPDGQAGQFSSLMDTAGSMAKFAKNDIRDSFFKMGGSEMYKDFLKPGAESLYGGALKLDLFNNDFFKDLGNITSVFGGSKDIGEATERYLAEERKKYPAMAHINWEEGYDRGELDNYNRQVHEYNTALNNYFNDIKKLASGSQSIFTPAPASSSKNIFSSSKPAMSVASAPMSFATPKFSSPNMSIAKPQMSMASAPQMSKAPNMSVAPKPASRISGPMSLPSGRIQGPMSVAPKPAPRMSVAPKPAPQMSVAPRMSVASKSVGTQSKPSSNIFSRVSSAVKSIFRRQLWQQCLYLQRKNQKIS